MSRREEWFRTFDPVKTALLVVDMQKHWVDERGACYIPGARGIVPNINKVASALRSRRGTIVWIESSMATNGADAWPQLFERMTDDGEAERAELIPGHPMHGLWGDLDIRPSDCRVAKNRFSAFIHGSSNIEQLLRTERGVDTVLIAGVATHICCESTARDAMMRDFRTVMLEDANAARQHSDHLAGLSTFAQVFGAVMATDEVISRLT